MDNEILVSSDLNQEMIDAGKSLIEHLDRKNALINSAMWFYISEDEGWKLLLTSKLIIQRGPKYLYTLIDTINNEVDKKIPLKFILLSSPDNPLIQTLCKAISTGDGISGIRFSKNYINGQMIEDSYIYRMTTA